MENIVVEGYGEQQLPLMGCRESRASHPTAYTELHESVGVRARKMA
jgi:hypothetical protein